MTFARPTFALLCVAAALAVIAEAVVAWRDRLPLWVTLPCAAATGVLVLFAGVALDAVVRHAARPDKDDIAGVRDLQHRNAALLDAHAERLAQAETRLVYLYAQETLADRLGDVARAGERVETWVAVTADLPAWTTAVERWSVALDTIATGLAPEISPAREAELQAARALLPPAHNFSSPDLKAALAYVVQRERVAAAYNRLQDYGRSLA